MATSQLNSLLSSFTNNNSDSLTGSCNIVLMGGPVPTGVATYATTPSYNYTVPTLQNLTMAGPNHLTYEGLAQGDTLETHIYGPDYITNQEYGGYTITTISSLPNGTYSATNTWWGLGLTTTYSVTITNNTIGPIQLVSSSGAFDGNLNYDSGDISVVETLKVYTDSEKTQLATKIYIPNAIASESGGYVNLEIPVYAEWTTPEDSWKQLIDYRLVTWKNNRVKYADGAISTYSSIATASGNATWFYGNNSSDGSTFTGTVGETGSGADLELGNVNIVQGKTYGISNLRIQIPTSFTY